MAFIFIIPLSSITYQCISCGHLLYQIFKILKTYFKIASSRITFFNVKFVENGEKIERNDVIDMSHKFTDDEIGEFNNKRLTAMDDVKVNEKTVEEKKECNEQQQKYHVDHEINSDRKRTQISEKVDEKMHKSAPKRDNKTLLSCKTIMVKDVPKVHSKKQFDFVERSDENFSKKVSQSEKVSSHKKIDQHLVAMKPKPKPKPKSLTLSPLLKEVKEDLQVKKDVTKLGLKCGCANLHEHKTAHKNIVSSTNSPSKGQLNKSGEYVIKITGKLKSPVNSDVVSKLSQRSQSDAYLDLDRKYHDSDNQCIIEYQYSQTATSDNADDNVFVYPLKNDGNGIGGGDHGDGNTCIRYPDQVIEPEEVKKSRPVTDANILSHDIDEIRDFKHLEYLVIFFSINQFSIFISLQTI